MRDEREAMWDGWEISAMKLQREESRWRNKEGRERREQKKWEGWEGNFRGNRRSKIFFFFCNTMNSTILCLELYYSSIAKKIAILPFTIPWCKSFLGLKCQIFLRYGISIPNANVLSILYFKVYLLVINGSETFHSKIQRILLYNWEPDDKHVFFYLLIRMYAYCTLMLHIFTSFIVHKPYIFHINGLVVQGNGSFKR